MEPDTSAQLLPRHDSSALGSIILTKIWSSARFLNFWQNLYINFLSVVTAFQMPPTHSPVQISHAADGGAKVCLPWNYLRIIWTAWQMFEPHAPPFVEGLKQLFFLDPCHSRASWDALVGWNRCDVNAAACGELRAPTIKLLTVILLCALNAPKESFCRLNQRYMNTLGWQELGCF